MRIGNIKTILLSYVIGTQHKGLMIMADYLAFAVQAFFTGVGTATGLWFHERFIKPRLEAAHHKAEDLLKGNGGSGAV